MYIDMVGDMKRFTEALEVRRYPSLRVDAEVFPDEFHVTVQTLNLSRGLRRLFDAPGFLPLPPSETEDVARVMAGTARRIIRLLERRNLEHGDHSLAGDDPLLATLMAASIRSRIATGPGAGQPWRRLGDGVEPADGDATVEAPPRCSACAAATWHGQGAARRHARPRKLEIVPETGLIPSRYLT